MLTRRTPVLLGALALLTLLMAGCDGGPTPVPSPTPVPPPTLTPSPTPTATPIPPMQMSIPWPETVSALQPVTVAVELVPPPGVGVTATARVAVIDPARALYREFTLAPEAESLYVASDPLFLPLEPMDGEWLLAVYADSELLIEGDSELLFRPAPIRFRDLAGVLPDGIDIHVPRDFDEVVAQGDQVAGARVWRHGGGQVELWWAPGPDEPLKINTAVVMLETTHDPAAPPSVEQIEEMVDEETEDTLGFLFSEAWPGAEGGPARVQVLVGPDGWLYVVRARALGGDAVPLLMQQVWETFAFVDG